MHHHSLFVFTSTHNSLNIFCCLCAGRDVRLLQSWPWPLHRLPSPTMSASFRLRWRPCYTPSCCWPALQGRLQGRRMVCLACTGVQVRQTLSHDFPMHSCELELALWSLYLLGFGDPCTLVFFYLTCCFVDSMRVSRLNLRVYRPRLKLKPRRLVSFPSKKTRPHWWYAAH
jgi:hypothetical protein